jgi:hypothetical protein
MMDQIPPDRSPFAEPYPVGEGASPMEQLLGLLGRDPRRS